MSKYSIPLLLGLLIAWITIGTLIYNRVCCLAPPNQPLLLSDGDVPVLNANENLKFAISGHQPIISTRVQTELQKLSPHLQKNPDKLLVLTGKYLSEENNASNAPNLGLGRAEALKSYLLNLGIPQNRILTEEEAATQLLTFKDTIYNGMDMAFTPIPYYYLSIKDGTTFEAFHKNNLVFQESGFEYAKPLSGSIQDVYQQTADYLKNTPNRAIKITGLYAENEKNNSLFPNLGLARANIVKQILTNLGVAPQQILTDARIEPTLVFQDGQLTGGIDYSFEALSASAANKAEDLEKSLDIGPLTLYFETNARSLQLSSEQRQYFSDLSQYLSLKPKTTINVTGHTDNKGERRYNIRLARKRAAFAKDHLIRNGIKKSQIRVTSEGPDQPIASNNSEEGRAKNRRVEITINK